MARSARRTLATLAAIGVACATASMARAQGKVEAGLRGSYVPLGSGDATRGRTAGLGMTAQIAVTLDAIGSTEASAFYTFVPRDEGRTPRIQMAGALLSVTGGIDRRLTGVGMAGVGIIDYTASGSSPCDLPFCSPDGGGSYPGGRHPTVILGLGIEGALSSRFRMRADVAEHLPVGVDDDETFTGSRRSDIGIGLRYLLRESPVESLPR